jgi:hypothetical protein
MKSRSCPFLIFALGMVLALQNAPEAAAQWLSSSLFRTFNNPTPVPSVERFGCAVASLDEDRILIGAHQDNTFALAAGAAYLVNTDGILLTTFTNLVPNSSFGISLAAIGPDKLVIGSPGADAAYLFDTNGTVLTIFTNPAPATQKSYGRALAVFNNEIVAIGAPGNGTTFFPSAGAVYLYALDGTLITTITNPNPNAFLDSFGFALGALGKDKLIIGAPGTAVDQTTGAGVTYLYNTNGVMISSIANPTPAMNDAFGRAVLALGPDRVLVGGNDSGAAGGAYLFHTNGALLRSFSSPEPAGNQFFGASLSVLDDLIIIGAPQSSPGFGGSQPGTAYIFNTNGTLLRTLLNPAPFPGDRFGSALAVLGNDRILIGAETKASGGYAPGAAFLFQLNFLPPPALTIQAGSTGHLLISWPPAPGFVLERSEQFTAAPNTNSWVRIPPPYQPRAVFSNGTFFAMSSVIEIPTTNVFYRLRQP